LDQAETRWRARHESIDQDAERAALIQQARAQVADHVDIDKVNRHLEKYAQPAATPTPLMVRSDKQMPHASQPSKTGKRDKVFISSNASEEESLRAFTQTLRQQPPFTSTDEAPQYPDLHRTRAAIDLFLAEQGIRARVVHMTRGPRVSRFDLDAAEQEGLPGRLKGLEAEFGSRLGERPIRVVPPTPGRPWVCIEVPNQGPVLLRDFFGLGVLGSNPESLTIALGEDTAGQPQYLDLASLPHLVIAGGTRQERARFTKTALASLLYQRDPRELTLSIVLPYSAYDIEEHDLYVLHDLPHVTRLEPAKWGIVHSYEFWPELTLAFSEKIEVRKELFKEAGVTSIQQYNALAAEQPELEKLPRIVIVVEEWCRERTLETSGELWSATRTRASDIYDDWAETNLLLLAQEGGQAGIHLVLSASDAVDLVMTPPLRDALPSRVVFRVPSSKDSSFLLNADGAQYLIGDGDALMRPLGQSVPTRIQTPHISDSQFSRHLRRLSQ
jgi:S-DNA-T family DNA segregation ATPase FtsK/SpoIIIE